MARTGLFISHAHEDRDLAGCLRRLLEDALGPANPEITCTSDADYGLERGENLKEQIEQRLESAKALFLLATPVSRHKDWVQFECAYASGIPDLDLYILVPTTAREDSVPAPFSNEVTVMLCSGADVYAFMKQLRQKFGIAEAGDPTHVPALLDLVDRCTTLERNTIDTGHRAAVEQEKARAGRDRKTFVALAVMTGALGLFGGLVVDYLRVSEHRADYAARLEALRSEHARSLDGFRREMSDQILKAEQARDAELKSLPFAGVFQDGLSRTVRCTEVEANVPDAAKGQERKLLRRCDDSGRFAFSGLELQADPRERILLKVIVGSSRYELPVTRADARLAIALPMVHP
jgi:TIR domain